MKTLGTAMVTIGTIILVLYGAAALMSGGLLIFALFADPSAFFSSFATLLATLGILLVGGGLALKDRSRRQSQRP